MMTERKERIAKDLEAAEQARAEAEGFKADYAAQIIKHVKKHNKLLKKQFKSRTYNTRTISDRTRNKLNKKNRARQDIAIERDRI